MQEHRFSSTQHYIHDIVVTVLKYALLGIYFLSACYFIDSANPNSGHNVTLSVILMVASAVFAYVLGQMLTMRGYYLVKTTAHRTNLRGMTSILTK